VLSVGLGILVAINPALPAFAKYKDRKDIPNTLWSYDDFSVWKNVSPICVAGTKQSPIDVQTSQLFGTSADKLGSAISYGPAKNVEGFNANNKTYQVQGNFGTLALPDGEYEAKQFHLHFPAEHTVDGKLYDGELHIVHFKQNNANYTGVSIAVVAVMLEIIPENPVFKFFEALVRPQEVEMLREVGLEAKLPENGKTVAIKAPTDLSVFRKELDGKFYHYKGSLTTPPCSENVHWYIAEKPAPVTKQMFDSWVKTFGPNTARPIQNGKRKVVESGLSLPGEFSVTAPAAGATQSKVYGS